MDLLAEGEVSDRGVGKICRLLATLRLTLNDVRC